MQQTDMWGSLAHTFLGFLTVACVHLGHVTSTIQGRQPHIVFVLSDDQGFYDVGYHGSEIQTPNLDRISAEGVRLENYYVQPRCSPTRSQLMTGRYQIHMGMQHGVILPEQPRGLPLDNPTLGDKLKEAGYATHYVGKWHLGFCKKEYLPINRGFDTFYGLYLGGGDHYNHSRQNAFARGVEFLDLHDQDEPVFNQTTYSTHLFTQKAIQRIRNHNPEQYRHLHDVLRLLQMTHMFWLVSSLPLSILLGSPCSCSCPTRPSTRVQVPDSYITPYRRLGVTGRRLTYDGMVAAMDEGVGNVTRALVEAGMWNDTVFVFSTDNGGTPDHGGNNFPLRGSKSTLWEGGVRAVGFVRAPELSTSNTSSQALIHVSDWFPTLVGLAAGSLNGTQPLDGVDQWPTISQGVASSRTRILHNIDEYEVRRGSRWSRDRRTFNTRIRAAIREGDWKLITGMAGDGSYNPHPMDSSLTHHEIVEARDKNVWLFNVTADGQETTDLSSSRPDVVRRLLDALQAHRDSSQPVFYPDRDPNSNPSLRNGVWEPWLD